MAINSRNKGYSYERKIAKVFTKWTGFECKRTPASGGWAKTGDITPKNPEDMINFPLCVELKKRERWSFADLIKGSKLKTGILSWWEQCITDAQTSNKIPLLVFSRNLDINYACMYLEDFEALNLYKEESLIFGNLAFFKLDDLLGIEFNKVCTILRRLHE